jgi:hypothetical protein
MTPCAVLNFLRRLNVFQKVTHTYRAIVFEVLSRFRSILPSKNRAAMNVLQFWILRRRTPEMHKWKSRKPHLSHGKILLPFTSHTNNLLFAESLLLPVDARLSKVNTSLAQTNPLG